jgi:uncharacterized protein YjiS (DUF1127 family)
LSDPLSHLPPWLKGDDQPLWHPDLLARFGIASLPGLAFFDLKHTEIAQFEPSFLHQGLDDPIENLLHNFPDLCLMDSRPLGNRFGHVLLGHGLSSVAAEATMSHSLRRFWNHQRNPHQGRLQLSAFSVEELGTGLSRMAVLPDRAFTEAGCAP